MVRKGSQLKKNNKIMYFQRDFQAYLHLTLSNAINLPTDAGPAQLAETIIKAIIYS